MTALLTDKEIKKTAQTCGASPGGDFIIGARFARDFYEARLAEDAKVRAGLELALTAAIDRMCSEGCDCGTDEPETCALCVCEAALAVAREIK